MPVTTCTMKKCSFCQGQKKVCDYCSSPTSECVCAVRSYTYDCPCCSGTGKLCTQHIGHPARWANDRYAPYRTKADETSVLCDKVATMSVFMPNSRNAYED